MGTEKTFINLATLASVSEHLKDFGITNPTVEDSTRNIAMVSMIGKPITVNVEIHVELIPKRSYVVGKDNCFPKMIMEIPKDTVIGPWKLERAHVVEFKHWAKKDSKGIYLGESYPEALKEKELDMTVIEKTKAVKTDAPTPTAIADNDKAIARKVMAKLGNDMDKFLEISKVAEMLGWDYVDEHYGALVKGK